MQKDKCVFVNVLNTMTWWFLITGPVLISFITPGVLCGINFEMVRNIGDSSSPVSRMIEIENGTDVSFSCKIVDSESTNYVDNGVVWGKKPNGLRFNNMLRSSILSFSPITLKDQGIHFCASLKHGLYETIYFAVRASDGFNVSSETRRESENDILDQNNVARRFENGSRNHSSTIESNSFTRKRRRTSITADDIKLYLKQMLGDYDTEQLYGNETFYERFAAHTIDIVPRLFDALVISIILLCLVWRCYASYRKRNPRTEDASQHPVCGEHV